MAYTSTLAILILSFSSVTPVGADMFLGRPDRPNTNAMTLATKQALLAELEQELGSEHRSFTERRLAKIEDALRPLFNAMPRNNNGLLGHSAVTFLLHRVFVLRHGWYVRGLDPEDNANSAFNESSATAMLGYESTSSIQQIFEKRLGGNGATLHEIAVLAATLEHMVHKEAMSRLDVVYKSHSFTSQDVISETEALEVLDTYMSVYILGFLLPKNASSITTGHVMKLRESISEVYPHWPEVLGFVREVKAAVMPKRDYFYFADIANVVEEIGDRYGAWQDKECVALKNELLAIEDKTSEAGAGRVRLADFYKKAMYEEKYQFSESVDYLRQLGALDESDPENPKLLIVNYANAPSNCVASSNYYSVCCRNDCEDLLGQLETSLAKPEATPAEIIALVRALPSRTTPTNRALPLWLLKRLDEVANHHGGVVPLHSRLFMQFMHFAYPRECPYPHAAGVTSFVKVEDVVKDDDPEQYLASNDDMMRHIEAPLPNATVDADAMWTAEEELIVWRGKDDASPVSRFRSWLFMGSVASMSMMLVKFIQTSVKEATTQSASDKYYV